MRRLQEANNDRQTPEQIAEGLVEVRPDAVIFGAGMQKWWQSYDDEQTRDAFANSVKDAIAKGIRRDRAQREPNPMPERKPTDVSRLQCACPLCENKRRESEAVHAQTVWGPVDALPVESKETRPDLSSREELSADRPVIIEGSN